MHTSQRWSNNILDSLKSRLSSRITIDKEGCWIYEGQNYRTPLVSIKAIKNCQIGIHYLSAFLYRNYDLNSDKKVERKCNKQRCCNPECLIIIDKTSFNEEI